MGQSYAQSELTHSELILISIYQCNAFTEGINNIKALKCISYGYRSFENFRRRILCGYGDNGAA